MGEKMTEFGIFLPNGSNGYVISEGVKPYPPTFEHHRLIVEEAEKQNFSYALPMVKFKGFGGKTGFWDECLEPFTLTSALAAMSSKLKFIPTVGLLALHPAYTARMTATISNLSQGRVGLNIVTGWNKKEYNSMDLWPGDEHYNDRYEFAAEYVSILKELWETGKCDRKSNYWNLDECSCLPTAKYDIPIISAGQSPAGKAFCGEFADQRFMFGHPPVLDDLEQNKSKKLNYGSYIYLHIITEKTDQQAKAIGEEIIKKADKSAIENMISSSLLDTNKEGTSAALQAALGQSLENGNMAFTSAPVIYGTPKTVASKLNEISERTGCDGFMFSWNDYVSGIKTFGEEVRPYIN
tara:strand:- start:866 stop:1921 length:1056 start_codon:yes stop_codon:yes gene_type:complete